MNDLSPEDLERLWSSLGAEDAGVGHGALWALASVPRQAVSFLKGRLRPDPGEDAERIRRLVGDLDSDRFSVRDVAARELEGLGADAEGALRRALSGKMSPEVRRRVEALLSGPSLVRSPEKVRRLRAVMVLEQVGTPEARELLRTLAKGESEARLTREAKASLQRLAKRTADNR